jgi:uncharacterized protein (DUF1499 family)
MSGGVLAVVVVVVVVVVIFGWRLRSLALASRAMAPPAAPDGPKLAPCPSPMRCVCSDESGEAFVEPLAVGGTPDEVERRVVAAIEKLGGVVRTRRNGYLHAEFRTRLWGFVDDVEMRLGSGPVAIRSASRVGKSDLRANRKRVEALRAVLNEG